MDKISDRLNSHERRIRGARAELHEVGKEIGKVEDHFNARLDMVSRFLDQFMAELDSLDGRVERHQEAADRAEDSQDQFMFSLQDRLALVEHEQLEIRSELAEIMRRLDALPATERNR